jgi:hypothetical protein
MALIAEQLKELRAPRVVAAGGSVYNAATNKFEQAPEKTKQTDLQINYEYAKNQGFTGSIFDYERKLKEAGRPPAAPRPEPAPSITTIIDPTDPTKMIAIDARVYKGGGVGSPGVIGVGGKEPGAALREGKSESGKTQLADDLDNLRSSFTRLNEMRAIPSIERNVASNLMSAAGASGIGQALGKAGGSPEQVAAAIGVNPSDLKARIVNYDGQPKVDYYTKDLSQALFGDPLKALGAGIGSLFGAKTGDQQVAEAVAAAREGGGGRGQQQVEVAPAVTAQTAPPPYMTELSAGNLALPSISGLTAEQWAAQNAGGDMSRVHARIKYVNGAPMLEYYTV